MFQRNPDKMHSIANDRPDWEGIPEHELNRWQKIAKRTKGWVTTANGMTIFGTVVVMNGLADFANGQHVMGTAKVAGGRLLDLADGAVADKQGVKGPVGKRLDVVADMTQLAVALPVLYATDTLPLVPLVAVAAPKAAGTIGSLAAEMRGREVNVNSDGKLATAGIWSGVAFFMLAKAAGSNDYELVHDVLEGAGYISTLGAGALSVRASGEYLQAGFGSADNNHTD